MNKLLTNSFGYLLIGFLPLASNFIIAPIFTRYLSTEEYGILALASLIQAAVAVFIDIGITGAFSRYYFQYYTEKELKHKLLSTSILAVCVFGVIMFVLLWLLGDTFLKGVLSNNEVFSMSPYGWIAFLLAVNTLLQSLLLILYRNEENIKQYIIVAAGSFLMMTFLSVLGVVYFEAGALGSLWGKLLGMAIVIIPFVLYKLSRIGVAFDRVMFKQLFKYGLPLLPYAILGLIIDNLDKVFIERWVGVEQLGLYNVGFLIASIPNIMIHAGQSTINPSVFKELEHRMVDKGNFSLKPYFAGFLVFILLFCTGLVAISEEVIGVYLGPAYYGVSTLIPIILLAFFFRALYVTYATTLFFFKETKLLPWINFVSLIVGILAAYWLIPSYGIIGASWCVVLIKASQFFTLFVFLKASNRLYIPDFSLPNIWLLYGVVFSVWLLLLYENISPASWWWWCPVIICLISLPLIYRNLKGWLEKPVSK